MAKIQGFRVSNFNALRDVTLGRLVKSSSKMNPARGRSTFWSRRSSARKILYNVTAYKGVGRNGQRQNHSAGGTDISVCAHTCWGEKPDLPVLVKTQGASLIKR